MTARIVIKYNHLPQLAKRLPEVVGSLVRKAAYDIEAHAKSIVPVDTGKLKNSISVEMPKETLAIIAPHTEYAGYVEYGTRRQRAKPYMRPAAEKVAPSFLEACRKLEDKLR